MALLHDMSVKLLIMLCFYVKPVEAYRLGWTTLDKNYRVVNDNVGKLEDMVQPAFIKGKNTLHSKRSKRV